MNKSKKTNILLELVSFVQYGEDYKCNLLLLPQSYLISGLFLNYLSLHHEELPSTSLCSLLCGHLQLNVYLFTASKEVGCFI